jgi:DNA processing protein
MKAAPLEDELWTEEEQAYWLAFDRLTAPRLSGSKAAALFGQFQSLKTIWQASKSELREFRSFAPDFIDSFVEQRRAIEPLAVLEQIKKQDIQAYPNCHPLFPALLREITNQPLILYVKGKISPEELINTIGVVGTRRPTSYGQRLAKQYGRELAQSGVTVISGMAIGIDSIAHWGAIEGGGKTIAVLASGVDLCYPSSNKPLYNKLVSGDCGAVVSEYFPGTEPQKWHFPERNRIISGLSSALIVVEAGEESGALITANLHFDASRDVFAVPGRLDNPMSKGTNKLIADNKAALMTGCERILADRGWAKIPKGPNNATIVQLYGREKDVFELISQEPMHFDDLCLKCGVPPGEMSATLTMLELAGAVVRQPGDWYARII